MGLIFFPLGVMLVLVIINLGLYLVARFGGWYELAERFPETTRFDGKEWRFRCMNLGKYAGYKNIVTIGTNARGLRFSLPWFFSCGHVPFFIPWSAIVGVVETRVLWLPVTELEIQGTDRRIYLPRALASELLRERPADAEGATP